MYNSETKKISQEYIVALLNCSTCEGIVFAEWDLNLCK
jgi:hypothetical protein